MGFDPIRLGHRVRGSVRYMVTDLSDYDLLNVIRTRQLTDECVAPAARSRLSGCLADHVMPAQCHAMPAQWLPG